MTTLEEPATPTGLRIDVPGFRGELVEPGDPGNDEARAVLPTDPGRARRGVRLRIQQSTGALLGRIALRLPVAALADTCELDG